MTGTNKLNTSVLLVVPIRCFRLPGNFGRGIKLTDTIFLSNESTNVTPYFSDLLKEHVGLADINLISQKGVVYAYSKSNSGCVPAKVPVEEKLNSFLLEVNLFLNWLWLIRDNAAFLDCGFALAWDSCGANHICKNYLGNHTYKAKGGAVSDTTFSVDEIRTVREIYQTMLDAHPSVYDLVCARDYTQAIHNLPEVPRLIRCFNEVQDARLSNSIAHKVSIYITALETLFSTSPNELTYRLSERTAFFLGESSNDRKDIFKFMKDAYAVRSSVVHGSTLGKKARSLDYLIEVSVRCDELVRQSLHKILSDERLGAVFTSDNDALDAYFTDLILC
jgi:hypothetical protein